MSRAVPVVLIMVWSFILTGCQDKNVLYDMAMFDRSYIPALVLTSKKDTTGQSVVALKRLRQDWGVLTAKRAAVFAADARSEKIKEAIDRADSLVTIGDFKGAHTELESIREILLDARRQYKIDYYVDYLTVFHSTMEAMVSAVEGKAPGQLTGQDIATIKRFVPEARAQWNNVREARFSRGVFLFTRETKESLDVLVAQEARNLEDLAAAIRSGNHKLIIKHTLLIKKGYSSVFRMFGNFESVTI